jgi:hypothetical protein
MKKAESKKGKGTKKAVYPVQLKRLSDLAMNSTSFDGARPIYAFREGDHHVLYAQSIKLGDPQLVFYLNQRQIGKYILFRPQTPTDRGACEFTDTSAMKTPQPNTHIFPIIEFEKAPYEVKKARLKVNQVGIVDFEKLLKGIMMQHMDGGVGKVFAFRHGGNAYISTFHIIDDDDIKTFSYAKAALDKDYGFFRYNYSEDRIEPTDVFGEPSYLYVRIIHLAEAFPFFKPE